ncbi:PadR family transcriptional regulator [Candidatus Bipolaricaulota bacterium]|nr:PadR family transcriptional regulator [Candidatus Bipolaricaulota bacterium]
MKLLSEDSYSGYGLIQEIEEETGFWKPSTGSVYPLLESLEEEGLIEGRDTDRGSSWEITDKGREAYREASEAKQNMKESLKQSMIVFSQIFNEEGIKEVANRMESERERGDKLRAQIHGLHHRLNDIMDEPACGRDKIREIVEETHKKLDELGLNEG